MSGTQKRAARRFGGAVMKPPETRNEIEATLGQTLTDSAWQDICAAFEEYGRDLDALNASRTGRTRDKAKKGWHLRQKTTVTAIEKAMAKVQAAKSEHDDFLLEASENYCVANFGRSVGSEHNAQKILNEAYALLLKAATIVERSELETIETPTESGARKKLVRKIFEACERAGTQPQTSDGREHDRLLDNNGNDKKVAVTDLTPFEQMIFFMDFMDQTPAAFARWMRDALKKE